jgi:hypothetical protein
VPDASQSAAGAAMLDLDRRRGALANSSAPGAGTAAGAPISALAVQYLPAPAHVIYLVLLGVLAAQAAGVLGMRGMGPSRPCALRSLVPDIRLPRAVRSEFAIAAAVLFALWALAGFFGSPGPALAATVLRRATCAWALEYLAEPLTVADLARHAGWTPPTTARRFPGQALRSGQDSSDSC